MKLFNYTNNEIMFVHVFVYQQRLGKSTAHRAQIFHLLIINQDIN